MSFLRLLFLLLLLVTFWSEWIENDSVRRAWSYMKGRTCALPVTKKEFMNILRTEGNIVTLDGVVFKITREAEGLTEFVIPVTPICFKKCLVAFEQFEIDRDLEPFTSEP